ncbi:MAG: response regulator receiver protein [Sphingobacteriales bacterium]|nr:response regulator receiver protein [Sphingobacteriales bacterium]
MMDKRILICDDDTDILSICTYILEEQNWEVHTKTNCIDITEVVRSIKPSVILMDNWIPDTGGIVATQSIKADPELSNIPIIYFSANNDIKSLAKEAGADAFLEKPFDIEDLERVVLSVLKQFSSTNT